MNSSIFLQENRFLGWILDGFDAVIRSVAVVLFGGSESCLY